RGAKAAYACRDDACCRRGLGDMLANPRRHFLITRLNEVSRLSVVPESLRSQIYMEEFLRPASDLIIKAAAVEPKLKSRRHHLDSWRAGLGAVLRNGVPSTASAAPTGRRIQTRKGA